MSRGPKATVLASHGLCPLYRDPMVESIDVSNCRLTKQLGFKLLRTIFNLSQKGLYLCLKLVEIAIVINYQICLIKSLTHPPP